MQNVLRCGAGSARPSAGLRRNVCKVSEYGLVTAGAVSESSDYRGTSLDEAVISRGPFGSTDTSMETIHGGML